MLHALILAITMFTPCDHYVDAIVVSLDGPLLTDLSGRELAGTICHRGAEVLVDDGLEVTVDGEPWTSESQGTLEVWEVGPDDVPVCACHDAVSAWTQQCSEGQGCAECCRAEGGLFGDPVEVIVPPCWSCPDGSGCC